MTYFDSNAFDKLDALLEENLDNLALPLDVLCRKIGLSRSQLHRVVKAKTQLSVTLFIRKKRLEKAKTLLAEASLRISEIAYLVGFGSPQNFSKYFFSAFQITPTDFRNQVGTRKSTTSGTSIEKVSIAVLPFVNISNDSEQEYFSDGITEEIINVLSHVPKLNVAGRTSCFKFKGNHQDIRIIGDQLNVAYILEGSVRKSGERLRITAQLVEVKDGFHVWSDNFDQSIRNIFEIQDEIALAILKVVKVQLLGNIQETALKRYTDNPTAYQHYLHGRFYHNKFAGPDQYYKAIEYYQAAIELEPEYAIAYAGIASCYLNLWFYRHLPSGQALPLMKQATGQALRLDGEMAESYLALARMELLYNWDFNRAALAFRKALELNWNTAELYCQYALFWSIQGNYKLAEEQIFQALVLEPFSLINNFYASYVYWAAGNFEKAVAQGRRLVALEPAFWGGHSIVGLNLITLKKYEEALEELEIALRLNYSGLTLSACGVLYGLTGAHEKAIAILEEMKAINQQNPVANYDMGIVPACMGDLDTACTYFDIAMEMHEAPMLFFKYIARDWLPDFENDPRYSRYILDVAN